MAENWGDQLQAIAAKSERKLDQVVRATMIGLFSATVDDTRVKTGRLKGNWQTQADDKPTGELDRLDPHGDVVNAEIQGRVETGGVMWFVNNLPYAAPMEQLDGMVTRNVARVSRILEEKARVL